MRVIYLLLLMSICFNLMALIILPLETQAEVKLDGGPYFSCQAQEKDLRVEITNTDTGYFYQP